MVNLNHTALAAYINPLAVELEDLWGDLQEHMNANR